MTPDLEAERLLLRVVPGSPFAGRALAVGGFVRDQILGLESKDLDLVVEEPGGAERLARWLHARFPESVSNPHALGAGYPIWQVVFKEDVQLDGELFRTQGAEIEIADTQSECFPDPNTRQRVTRYGSIEEDCRRRDFTVNMLYKDLANGDLVDPSGAGRADLARGVLRGHPQSDLDKIFSDDPLRMLRLVRFHARFGWEIPTEVSDCARRNAERMRILSAERVRGELEKIMLAGRLHLALKLMLDLGQIHVLLPELLPMVGCGQDRVYHSEGDVWTHTLLVVSHAPPTIALQLAALFHDVGKPATRSEHGERVKFLGHETISAEITEQVLARLKFGHALAAKVLKLVRLHLRGGDVRLWTGLKPARKLMRDAGEELEDLLRLIEADSRSSLGPEGEPRLEHIPALREKIAAASVVPLRRQPVLSGHDIMETLGLQPGRHVRTALEQVTEWEDEAAERGEILSREDALRRLREWAAAATAN